MKKIFKKFLLFTPLLLVPISLTTVLVSCSSNATKVSKYSLINNNVVNAQTQLINNLSLSMRQINDNSVTTATGFVFDQTENSKTNTSTFYVMTNFHFYMSAFSNTKDYQNPINGTSLSLSDANIGQSISSWNYLVNDFDFRLANTNTENPGDVYLLNNEYSNYDAVVYAITINMNNQNIPKAFKFFDENKQKIKYNTVGLDKQNISSTIITSGGYPKIANNFEWNQYSNHNLGTSILMDPQLVNYPTIDNKTFNNEIIYPVQGMTMKGGASGSLVLDNSDNSLLGIYFGFLGQNEKSYGMYIPFVAYEEYLQISFKDTKGNEWYFDVVNTNPDLVQIQTNTWLPNNIVNYQTKNYTNLVDAKWYNSKITNSSNKQQVLQTLSQDNDVYINLVRNVYGSNKQDAFLSNEPINVSKLASELLKVQDYVNLKLVKNEQNLFKSWVNFAQQTLKTKTFLSEKMLTNLK